MTIFAPLLLLSTLAFTVQDAEPIVVREVLVIDGVPRSRRSPVFVDPVEAALAAGTFTAPKEGDAFPSDRGERTWRKVTDENGSFGDRAIAAGYAFATVESPRDQVLLLEARGHRCVYVNGEPRGGDVYNLGLTRWPIALRAGTNELLFRGGRGNLQIRLVPPPAPVFLETRDALYPQLIRGDENDLPWGSIQVTNATTEWQRELSLWIGQKGPHSLSLRIPPIGPSSALKVGFVLPPCFENPLELRLERIPGGQSSELFSLDPIELAIKEPTDKHIRTFLSRIDGSVQAYAVTPPRPAPDGAKPRGLVLSLHGAGVDGRNQAHHYRPTDWATIVSPTNRRPFGFDWEDWGRWDALEALADAQKRFDTDPRLTVLTGHSMGGHGTWQLGVHFPDLFAAIGPSAGWRDFWSYAGAAEWGEEAGPVERLMDRAVNGSRTTLLERNLEKRGVYILHGDRDDNVPVSQARFMRQRLAEFHPNFTYYERPGAGHWWGNPCMDWPPLMDFLKQNTPLPADRDVRQIDFRTVHPGISSKLHWITVEAQERNLAVSHVEARLDAGKRLFTLSTDNVRRLRIDLGELAAPQLGAEEAPPTFALAPSEPVTVEIDGQTLGPIEWPETSSSNANAAPTSPGLRLHRTGDGWQSIGEVSPRLKGPHRAGAFKDAFRNHVKLVIGTRGTAAENAWAYAKARFDAETFAYRGNGAFKILRDVDLDPAQHPDHNLILYGNADTNAAWKLVIPDCPVTVRRGEVQIGERSLTGDDLGCLLIFPRAGSDLASVGVVAGTGAAGQRLTHRLPYFVSGIAYPDWTVIGTDLLEAGIEGVRAAGFFAEDWTLGDDWAVRDED